MKENPKQAQKTIQRLIHDLNSSGNISAAEQQKTVAAIVGAAFASMPRDRAAEVLNAALTAEPGLSPVIAQTALAVFPSGVRSSASSAIPIAGMVPGFARVLKVEGSDALVVAPNGASEPLRVGDFLQQGSSVSTGPKSKVDLLFENGTTIRIEPGTEFSLDRLMTSPFEADSIDYQSLREEPGSSNTLVGVPSGTILFDVAKLTKNSSFQISTPLGIAGIRGTSGFARGNSADAKAPVSFGLASGSADFTTPNGNRRSVGAGESFGVGGPRQGYAMESNPPDSGNLLQRAGSFGNRARTEAGAKPFQNIPPRPVIEAGTALSPAQIQALQQAALESGEALVQTAVLLAMESPVLAAEIAAFASALMPSMAIEVGLAISGLYPNLAPAIAAKAAAVVPAMAVTITMELIRQNPGLAASLASSVVAVVPQSAVALVSAVANELPAQASIVAAALRSAVPDQGDAVSETIQNVLAQGGPNNQGQPPITPPVPDNATQNPGTLNPLPFPTPSPQPTPAPTLTPPPTPVSPSA
ncbi:MAG: FecR domain-containing protein [Verrucomicrobiota bacterium]